MAEGLRLDAGVAARGVRVELAVAPGEILALIGPNGAGKSTSIQLVAGALRPDDGEVAIGAATVADARGFVPANRRRVGYLEQRPLLFPHLSVLDNVAYGPRSRGVGKVEARARAERELAAVGLAGFERRRPRELSGGQAQRVAIARALVHSPAVVFADEPTGALDQATGTEVMQVLTAACQANGASLVLVTHDVQVAQWCARQLALLDGRIDSDILTRAAA